MNRFIQSFDTLTKEQDITQAEEDLLVLYILNNSAYVSVDDFCRANIEQGTAEVVALSDKYFLSDHLKANGLDSDLIATVISEHPEYLARDLAINHPKLAIELLEELLYWRTHGRI